MQTTVLIADAARARFFRVAHPEDDDYEAGPRLREQDVLVNPEAQLTGKDLYENVKSGRQRAPGGGPAHGLDDHRARHTRELTKRFAQRVASATAERVRAEAVKRLILVAPPRALGVLREMLTRSLDDVRLDTVDSELTWHALPQIEGILEKRGLIDPRVMPEDTFRPPGQPLG